MSKLESEHRGNLIRSCLSDIKKSLQRDIYDLEDEQVSSDELMKDRRHRGKIMGIKQAIAKIERYEEEVVNLMFPPTK